MRGSGSNALILGKFSKRIFMAHRQNNPRENISLEHEMTVRGTFKQFGQNKIKTTLDRNMFHSDDSIKTKTTVDNKACSARMTKLICKL